MIAFDSYASDACLYMSNSQSMRINCTSASTSHSLANRGSAEIPLDDASELKTSLTGTLPMLSLLKLLLCVITKLLCFR